MYLFIKYYRKNVAHVISQCQHNKYLVTSVITNQKEISWVDWWFHDTHFTWIIFKPIGVCIRKNFKNHYSQLGIIKQAGSLSGPFLCTQKDNDTYWFNERYLWQTFIFNLQRKWKIPQVYTLYSKQAIVQKNQVHVRKPLKTSRINKYSATNEWRSNYT